MQFHCELVLNFFICALECSESKTPRLPPISLMGKSPSQVPLEKIPLPLLTNFPSEGREGHNLSSLAG